MKLPAYPKYKPSGVEWLGEVPEHWEVKRLRRVLAQSLQYGANESAELDDPDLPRYVRITDVHENGTLRPDTFRSLLKDIAAPYLLKDGDILFARSGATSGKTFLYQNSWGICAYAGYLIRARMNQQKAVPAFVKYFTTSTNYWQWLSSVFIQSTIQNVSAEKYADLHLSLPPLPEQTSIAAFLDQQTGRIDTLIAKKRELIERLKEKRTALISRTVTRGLNPKVKLKPSGIEWLGDVPEHWEVTRLDFMVRVKARLGWKGLTASEYVPEGFIFLATPNIKGEGKIDFINVNYITAERYYESPEIMLQVGDVLMAKDGSTLGITNVVDCLPSPTTVNSSIAVLRPNPSLNSSYFFRWLTSTYIQSLIQCVKDGQGVPHLFQADIKKFPLLLPPLPEQTAIAAYLDKETKKLDALVGKVEEAVERLQEYRTSLITAAVTGKIDVRKFSD